MTGQRTRRQSIGLAGAIAGLLLLGAMGGSSFDPGRADAEGAELVVARLAARWCEAVSAHDAASFELLSKRSQSYYPSLQRLALLADADELAGLDPIDQLQVMFLRLMLKPEALEGMASR